MRHYRQIAILLTLFFAGVPLAETPEEDCLPGDEEEPDLLQALLGGAEETGLHPGDPAPPFTLEPLDSGREIRSGELFAVRELTALVLWDSRCPRCLRALIDLGRFSPRADSLGLDLLSIDADREHMAAVRAFVKGEKLPFPVLWDADGEVARRYRATAYSFSLFLIDREGIIRYLHYDRPDDVAALLNAEAPEILQQLRAPDPE